MQPRLRTNAFKGPKDQTQGPSGGIEQAWFLHMGCTGRHRSGERFGGDSRLHGIKRNGIMPFAATWMDLEIIILSEMRQRKTNII